MKRTRKGLFIISFSILGIGCGFGKGQGQMKKNESLGEGLQEKMIEEQEPSIIKNKLGWCYYNLVWDNHKPLLSRYKSGWFDKDYKTNPDYNSNEYVYKQYLKHEHKKYRESVLKYNMHQRVYDEIKFDFYSCFKNYLLEKHPEYYNMDNKTIYKKNRKKISLLKQNNNSEFSHLSTLVDKEDHTEFKSTPSTVVINSETVEPGNLSIKLFKELRISQQFEDIRGYHFKPEDLIYLNPLYLEYLEARELEDRRVVKKTFKERVFNQSLAIGCCAIFVIMGIGLIIVALSSHHKGLLPLGMVLILCGFGSLAYNKISTNRFIPDKIRPVFSMKGVLKPNFNQLEPSLETYQLVCSEINKIQGIKPFKINNESSAIKKFFCWKPNRKFKGFGTYLGIVKYPLIRYKFHMENLGDQFLGKILCYDINREIEFNILESKFSEINDPLESQVDLNLSSDSETGSLELKANTKENKGLV